MRPQETRCHLDSNERSIRYGFMKNSEGIIIIIIIIIINALPPTDDVDRQYVSRKEEGRGLASTEYRYNESKTT